MDRKEFLKVSWKKGIKPLLSLAVIYFVINFLIAVISENGPERFFTIFIGGLIILSTAVYLLSDWLKKWFEKLPASTQFAFRMTGKVLFYLVLVFEGYMLYQFWQKDWMAASVVLGAHLLVELSKGKERLTTKSE